MDEGSVGSPSLIDESLEQVNDTGDEPEVVELIEYVTVKRPAPKTSDGTQNVKDVNRKKQYGLSALTLMASMTILLYLTVNCCQKMRKQAQDRR